jgi:hypothetical protein
MESKLHENLFRRWNREYRWLRVDLTPECLDEWVYFGE